MSMRRRKEMQTSASRLMGITYPSEGRGSRYTSPQAGVSSTGSCPTAMDLIHTRCLAVACASETSPTLPQCRLANLRTNTDDRMRMNHVDSPEPCRDPTIGNSFHPAFYPTAGCSWQQIPNRAEPNKTIFNHGLMETTVHFYYNQGFGSAYDHGYHNVGC